MSLWLELLIVSGNATIVLRDPRRGVLAYAALALILPHTSAFGAVVTYEILAFPAVVVATAVRRPWIRHPAFHLSLLGFLGLVLFSSLLGTTGHGSALDLIRLQGVIRSVLLLALFREVLDRDGIESIILVAMAVNVLVGLIQLLVPGSAGTFLALYGRPSQGVLARYASGGFIPRAPGTLGSPVNLGAFALFGLAVSWARFVAGRREKRYLWLLGLSATAGILSVTKTFLLGGPLVLLAGTLMWSFVGRSTPRRHRLGVAVAALAAAGAVAFFLTRWGLDVTSYLSYVTHPVATLRTRYGEHGLLSDAVRVIADNPVLGVGMTRLSGEFLGDSAYVTILHSTGMVGAMLVGTGLVLIVRAIVLESRYPDLLIVGALLIAGIALPVLFTMIGVLLIIYLVARRRLPFPAAHSRLDTR